MTKQAHEEMPNRSIYRATQILLLLSSNVHTIKDIARHCDLSPSTVHRMLQALEQLDWVKQDPSTRGYYLGPLASQLTSNIVSAHKYLVMNCIDDMVRLSRITGETVTLGIMLHLRYVMLHDIPSRHDLRMTEGRDTAGTPARGATGRVMLSQLSDDEVMRALKVFSSWDIPGEKPVDAGYLLEEIKKIRKNGYSISYGEIIANSICISVPIHNYIYPAAISIIGPESRMQGMLKQCIEELKKYSEKSSVTISP